MFLIKDEYDNLLEETINPQWVKQQKRVDFPISARNYEEANGVILSDGKYYGIFKTDEKTGKSVSPNMNNYPQVTVEEVSGEPYIMQQLSAMQAQVKAMQAQSTTTGEQVKEIYAAQAGDVVVKSELDAAYQEGVNSL